MAVELIEAQHHTPPSANTIMFKSFLIAELINGAAQGVFPVHWRSVKTCLFVKGPRFKKKKVV